MKLIKVETKGFKSFADKISLTFDGGVVGIVGPNGSGKSNINDAIKWVLGEQSIKQLRGDSSEDVIFAGSKMVQASNEAEVTLTFDNSEHLVSLPHDKIIITRVIKRGEGVNKYYINGEEARLKDIKLIAMESGIGKSSLAIIGQGTISEIAEATPEKRRGVFEEAAGVSKYKSRKKEALRKLHSTTESLEKIKTIVGELNKQVAPLKRQAEKAKIFLEKKNELQKVEISMIVQDIEFYSTKLEEVKSFLDDVSNRKNNLEQNISKLESEINEITSFKLKLENEVLRLNEQYQSITDKLREIEINESRSSERRRILINDNNNKGAQNEALKEELNDLVNKIKRFKDWEIKIKSDIESKRTDVAQAQSKIVNTNFEIDNLKSNLLKLRTEYKILTDYKMNKSNLFKGVKTIINNKSLFPGLQGIVADLINIDDEYKKAFDTILASSLQHVVVSDADVAIKAVNFLKSNKAGRATFIPLASIKPKGFIKEHELLFSTLNGLIGKASELVSSNNKYDILVKFLLGNILVARTAADAKNIANTFNNRYMVVSLDGDIVRAGGVISGGEKNKTSELIGLDNQIDKTKQEIPRLESKISDMAQGLSKATNNISENQAIIAELNIEYAKVIEKLQITENQFNNLKLLYQEQTKKTFTAIDNDIIDNSETLMAEKMSIRSLLKAKRESIVNLNNSLSTYTIQKTEYDKSLRHLIENSSEQMQQKNQAEFIIDSHQKRLIEEYEMTFSKAKENFDSSIDVDEARPIVSRLRSEIKSLGHINLQALEMFEEVNERYQKMKSAEDELFSAQQTIIDAIGEMDQIIIKRLQETVDGINEEFNNVFTSMFGGGSAKVKYTNPSNLLETGIDVIAQPPGKTIRNLKLFSGGEKSLIAISLLFAVLKFKPLPLCILDEVEAALDDANVVRFAKYLQELKKQTQFIVITHRIGTMARVDHLFGATMQKRGVTSFFSVKLEEAKKYIEE